MGFRGSMALVSLLVLAGLAATTLGFLQPGSLPSTRVAARPNTRAGAKSYGMRMAVRRVIDADYSCMPLFALFIIGSSAVHRFPLGLMAAS